MPKSNKIVVWKIVHSEDGTLSTWESLEAARKELAFVNDSWEWEDGRMTHHPRCRIVKGWAFPWETDDPVNAGI